MYKRDRITLTTTLTGLTLLFAVYLAAAFFGWLPERFRAGIAAALSGGKGAVSGSGLADPDSELGIPIGDFRYRFTDTGFATVTMPRELNMEKETLEIPERVTWQGRTYRVAGLLPYAFLHQPALKTLVLPSGITETILVLCDPGKTQLEAIHVSPENIRLRSVDGVVFDRAVTKLLIYPPGRAQTAYTLPQGVAAIAPHAFQTQRHPVELFFADGSPAGQASSWENTRPSPL